MKIFVVIVLFGVLGSSVLGKPANQADNHKKEAVQHPEKLVQKYDNLDMDQILKSDNLLGNYVNCFLEKGKCSTGGAELKKSLTEAIHTDCSKCPKNERENIGKMIQHLASKHKQMWDELEKKYDPKREFLQRHKELSQHLQGNNNKH